MPLECTLVRSPGARMAQPPLELTVDAPVGSPGGELQAVLESGYVTGDLSVEGQPLTSLTVGHPPLVDGAVIVDGGTRRTDQRRRRAIDEEALLALAVVGGPGAGTVFPLRRGTYTIGRSNADVVLPILMSPGTMPACWFRRGPSPLRILIVPTVWRSTANWREMQSSPRAPSSVAAAPRCP
jgi:hypothetical protein